MSSVSYGNDLRIFCATEEGKDSPLSSVNMEPCIVKNWSFALPFHYKFESWKPCAYPGALTPEEYERVYGKNSSGEESRKTTTN